MSCRIWMPTLVNYFSTMKILDDEIEEVRSELCQNPNFIPKALFDSIDIDQKSYITLNDLKIYLNNHFLPFEEQSLRRLIHNFDKDHDFSIDYEEFLGLVLTKTNSSIANNVTNKIIVENYVMDSSIDNIFIKLLKLELNLVKTLSKIADELKYSKDFTTYEAFLCITKNEKYITVENLGEFLNECNINIESYDPFNLMCRLDNDGDGKISYEEFINIFFPYKEDYLQSDININKEKINSFTIQNVSSSSNNVMNQPSSIINNYYPYQNQNSNINYENENNENINSNYQMVNPNQFKNSNYNNINNMNYNNSNFNNQTFYNNEVSNYKLSSPPRKPGYNACGQREQLTQSPLGYNYIKGTNKKRNLSMDNTLRNTLDQSFNEENSPYRIDYNSPNKTYEMNSPEKTYNLKPINVSGIDEEYMSKLRTYTSPIKDNNYNYNLNNNINNDINRGGGYFTRSPKNNYNRTNIIKSPRVNLPNYNQNNNLNNNLNQIEIGLSNLLWDIVTQENLIEKSKSNLVYCNDINLSDLFQFFDYSQRNGVSKIDLIESLKELDLFISNEDANLIFQKYDKDFDNKLDYEEFCDMILPKKFSDAKIMCEKKPPSSFNGFSPDSKNKISKVFQTIIKGEKSIENNRRKLSSIPNSSPYDLFNMVNRNSCPGIYKEDFICLLEKNNKFLQPFETEILIDRFDKDQDGIITYNEFSSEIAPKM